MFDLTCLQRRANIIPRRLARSLRLSVCLLPLVLPLAGCGGSGDTTPPINLRTGKFYGPDGLAILSATSAVKLGKAYVQLQNDVPVEVGFELIDGALDKLPAASFPNPNPYFISLPPEADVTPFKLVAMANFTEGHLPVGFGDIAHIHPLFVMNPLAQPDPNQVKETTPVAPAEMAADHLKIEDIAGGIGQAYQDPTEPQAKANWYGIGYNYFYIAGHMNAVAAGATSTWLNDRQAGGTLTRSLKQPLVYPRPGYYPRTFTAYYDTTKKVWVFALRDFIAATRWVGNP